MVPDVASVMRKRYRMERTVRFGAVVLAAVGLITLGSTVVEVVVGYARGLTGARWALGLVNSAPLLFVAGLLGVGSGRIARWILPFPKAGCPRCGYRLVATKDGRCPECGLSLPAEFFEDSAKTPF